MDLPNMDLSILNSILTKNSIVLFLVFVFIIVAFSYLLRS